MKASLRLLATATATNGIRPAPMALLPPIPLYRRLLRAHRTHLPTEMRLLGDEYVKSEFRAHRNVDNPAHLLYAQQIEGDSWKGEKIDQGKVEKMSGLFNYVPLRIQTVELMRLERSKIAERRRISCSRRLNMNEDGLRIVQKQLLRRKFTQCTSMNSIRTWQSEVGSCKLTTVMFNKGQITSNAIMTDERPPKRRKQDNKHLFKIGGKYVDLGFSRVTGELTKPVAAVNAPKVAEAPREEEVSDGKSQSAEINHNAEATKKPEPTQKPGRPPRATDRKSNPSKGQSHDAMLKGRKALPIWAHRNEITSSIRKDGDDVLLVVGETGSGKSTQVPQFLCEEKWCRKKEVEPGVKVGGMIAITQPRRVAATTLANRVAREMGTPLDGRRDGHVGYSVRFDHNVPRGTKIKFLTEGMLLQELLRDPNLREYSAIVVDEIHERSVDVDLVTGFLKQIITGDKAGRGGVPLKVVIMSATADVERLQDFFSVPNPDGSVHHQALQLLLIKGRQYPVEIKHTDKPVPDIQDALFKQITTLHEQEPLPGDILAFLTGQEDIEEAQTRLEEYSLALASDVPKLMVCPLYGQLSIQAQQAALQPLTKKFTRKVVLATNIAETSVTVPGVRYVIDQGKAKVKQFRSQLGMESLLAKPISKSSAKQRTGRAGRESAGKCFRLYTADTYEGLKDTDLPEILRNDVMGAILTMKARGINDVRTFPLMDFPDDDSVKKALIHLHVLDALDNEGKITIIGRKIALFPVSAPYGRVLLAASQPEFDCLLEVIDVISCITSGENIFFQLHTEEIQEETEETRKELYRREGDILTYLTTMQQYIAENTDRIEWCKKRRVNIRNMKQAMNIRKQLRGLCLKENILLEKPPQDPQPFIPLSPERAESLLRCFMTGFVTKCALLAPDGSYVTVQGKHVVAIHPSSVLHGQKKEAIMFLEHVFTQKNYAKKGVGLALR
ncbi:P-loop containing nucleoside triphosphate hydrolase protein [Pseudomassariella vexata]|uniref:RNA helicase n=1 Tax=Pseudomassariella vexata TaxID=1141098 RepID=A0A1Y2DSC9_9PEZI|nr:P-loop containing nucleoside triphosphate hydrolase protein [Pseudomassariella vexata]ORY62183.1 P-loop containing nucleoside triphosphate hydrolase protein [Pseudomassariella vexata]